MHRPIKFSAARVAHMVHEAAIQEAAVLRDIVTSQVTDTCNFPDEKRNYLLDQVRARYGSGLQAVLIYGSYLRGKRDTLLDFYVFVESYGSMPGLWQGWLGRALPPNVYQIHHGSPPDEIRAKVALLTLEQFEQAVRKDFHSYFWARFAQPCGILYCRDDAVRNRIISAICQSCATFAQRVAPSLPDHFNTKQLWSEGLGRTYQCEFRSEPQGHAGQLFEYWPGYYRSVTLALAAQGLGFEPGETPDHFRNSCTDRARRWSRATWGLRRLQGKLLSTLRILKAAATFDGALDYLLWKIQRHSGVYIEPSVLQRQYPLIFAWPLLFRLWLKGAFR
jgi:hypothetical protein